LNDTLNTSLEANFNIAMNLSEAKYDYQTLMAFLASEKIVERQIAILELNEIKSTQDAQILVSNLVGQDGKIREAVAFKINELTQNPAYVGFFIGEYFFEQFMEAIMDINGNVCRNIVSLTTISEFSQYLCDKLPERINEILAEIAEIDAKTRQYVISKRNFQLYWSLEALDNIAEIINFDGIKDILFKTGEFYDYTIREKTAKIIAKLNNSELDELKEKLANDENYYVRRYLN